MPSFALAPPGGAPVLSFRPLGNAQLGGGRHDALGRVGERRVAEIVEEHRQAQRLPEAVAVRGLQVELGRERVEHARGHRHRPKPVGIPGVGRSGKGQVGEAELLHVAQPLVLRAVHQRALVRSDLDGAVDGVADVHLGGNVTDLRN